MQQFSPPLSTRALNLEAVALYFGRRNGNSHQGTIGDFVAFRECLHNRDGRYRQPSVPRRKADVLEVPIFSFLGLHSPSNAVGSILKIYRCSKTGRLVSDNDNLESSEL